MAIEEEPKKNENVESTSSINFEQVLENLGGFGRFQFIFLILILIFEIPVAFVAFIPVFAGRNPKDWTCDGNNITEDALASCNGTLQGMESSIVSEFGLVGPSAWVSDFITSLQMGGMVLGNVFGGKISDRYGRKRAFLVTIITMLFGTIASAISPNPYIYGVAKLFCGAGTSGFLGVSSVYTMEFMTPSWRHVCGCVGPWGVGIMALAGLAYFIRSWRVLTAVTALPFLLIVIIYPLIPESPRFLLRNQKIVEAHKVFNQIAKLNGKQSVSFEVIKEMSARESFLAMNANGVVARFSYLDFFRERNLRRITILISILWAVWLTTNFGIGFNIKNFPGNIYINVMALGLTDAVGYPASLHICNKFGRRRSLAFFMTLAAAFLVALAIFDLSMGLESYSTVMISLTLLGKVGISGARGVIRTLTGESFPTAIRTMGFCLVGIFGNIVSTLAPQLVFLGSHWPSIPLFAFAVISFVGAIVAFLLKETKGQVLEDEVIKPNSSTILPTMCINGIESGHRNNCEKQLQGYQGNQGEYNVAFNFDSEDVVNRETK